MTASINKRPAAIRVVIPFVFRHWRNQPALALTVAGGLLGATVADLFMPVFSGHLVDALTRGAVGLPRYRCARPAVHDPALHRIAGDRAVHVADYVRRGARRLHAGAAF